MAAHNEDQLRQIWREQTIDVVQMTSDQLRSRAEKFESTVRRRNVRDYMCFALVAIWSACVSLLVHGALTRIGAMLMGCWALLSMYWLYRYGSVIRIANADPESRLAFHRKQLERQRDIALSWPWGIGLVIPGFVLFAIGVSLGSAKPDWTVSIAMIGVCFFFYVAIVIDGKIRAAEWQREIDSLHALAGDNDV